MIIIRKLKNSHSVHTMYKSLGRFQLSLILFFLKVLKNLNHNLERVKKPSAVYDIRTHLMGSRLFIDHQKSHFFVNLHLADDIKNMFL